MCQGGSGSCREAIVAGGEIVDNCDSRMIPGRYVKRNSECENTKRQS